MNNTLLAEQLRPKTWVEVIGQEHLLGTNKPLRIAFESHNPHSMILWGPPGVGKTTLARLMANHFALPFIALSAVLSGVKDIREAVERAQVNLANTNKRTIVFVDEVHRFNKSQQDAFLPHVESGLFIFIGATTENPSFEVNSALLSRSTVYTLRPLSTEHLSILLERALSLSPNNPTFTAEAKTRLIDNADGDGRRLLNQLEFISQAAQAKNKEEVSDDFIITSLGDTLRRFDKGGDVFYDQISALHKSVRGSNPDASLYWLMRMLDSGADPRYLGRRLIRMASEDIGLADPRALEITLNAVNAYERLGSPEGELALAQATLYLACAAKSNAVYTAYNTVRSFIQNNPSHAVPNHLRNAPTKLMKELGHGKAYRYAHDEPDAYAAGETYLPDEIKKQNWYQPTPRGLEGKIREKLDYLTQLDEISAKNKKSS
jgi:putative ATPase